MTRTVASKNVRKVISSLLGTAEQKGRQLQLVSCHFSFGASPTATMDALFVEAALVRQQNRHEKDSLRQVQLLLDSM
jgi:hypothetical protein